MDDLAAHNEEALLQAARRVGELLLVPDQLDQVEQTTLRLKKKQVALEATLKTRIQSYLAGSQAGLEIISSSFPVITTLHNNFREIDKEVSLVNGRAPLGGKGALSPSTSLDEASEAGVPARTQLIQRQQQAQKQKYSLAAQYSFIKEVNLVRKNLRHTLREVCGVMQIPDRVRLIRSMLSDDRNFLRAHRLLREVETMRITILYEARDCTAEFSALEKEFEDVTVLADELEKKLWKLLSGALEVSKHRPEILVMALRVIEREETSDRKLMQQQQEEKKKRERRKLMRAQHKLRRLARKASGKDDDGYDDGNGSDDALSDDEDDALERRLGERYQRRAKGYMGQCFEVLQESIARRFESAISACRGEVSITLEQMEEMISDLAVVRTNVAPCFPPTYDIFNFYVREYHRSFHNVFKEFSGKAGRLPAKDILALVEWVTQHYETKMADIGLARLRPPLLEGLEGLTDAYCRYIRNLMEQWVERIVGIDQTSDPELVQGMYYTDTPQNVFSFINQQMDVARRTTFSKFIFEVFEECMMALSEFQDMSTRVIRVNWAEFDMEYLLAMVNNTAKLKVLMEEFVQRLDGMLDDPYLANVTTRVKERDEGFNKMESECLKAVANSIFRDLTDSLELLFTPGWECGGMGGDESDNEDEADDEDALVEAVLATFDDYFNEDISGYILEGDMRKLGQACMDRLVEHYLDLLTVNSLVLSDRTTTSSAGNMEMGGSFSMKDDKNNVGGSKKKEKKEQKKRIKNRLQVSSRAVKRIETDVDCIKKFFTPYVREKMINKTLDPFETIIKFLKVKHDDLVNTFAVLHHNHPEMDGTLVEQVLSLRADLDAQALTAMQEKCRALLG
eukprot:TRINITY_DN5506_c0_g1_i1.p1 TRINITY_DN5506_c0_g1~~TRINITY_DN5506_c0_g1_i1.p1  ORF type:complete len:852 (+),score=277.09 TRINITY_DN5506_c0_g1_i1:204-2759(+)